MKTWTSFFRDTIICTSMLLLVMQTSAYSSDKDTINALPAIQLLLNAKITVENAIAKAVAKFGDEVKAAMAILLSADQGYSWIQIVDAIDAGTLNVDGSITGKSPQGQLVRKSSLIKPYESADNVDPDVLEEALLEHQERYGWLMATIWGAVCRGYSGEQIIYAIITDNMQRNSKIRCSEGESKWKCYYDNDDKQRIMQPNLSNTERPFSDCDTMPDTIQGLWGSLDYYYMVTIRQKNYTEYSYSGTGTGYKHDGIIKWDGFSTYDGKLTDDPKVCCGNHGNIWLKKLESDRIRIRSKWFRPDGSVLKITDWEDLYYEGEVD